MSSTTDGERLFARAVANDQADLEALLDRAALHGTPGLVIDQPGSIAQLALAVAARRGVPVAYVPGLVMRRAADLYPGEAKTDRATHTSSRIPGGPAASRCTGWTPARRAAGARSGCSTGSTSTWPPTPTRLANRLPRRADQRLPGPGTGCSGHGWARPGSVTCLPSTPRSARCEQPPASRASTGPSRPAPPDSQPRSSTAIAAALARPDVTVPAEAATGRVIAELAARPRPGLLPPRRPGHRDRGDVPEPTLPVSCWRPCQGSGRGPAPRILAEIGDGSAFTSGSKLAAYAGAGPGHPPVRHLPQRESRSRRGNHRLKNAMFLAAFASLRDPASKTFYDRKRAEGNATTPPSSAWPAAAATSSWPCSAPTSPPPPHHRTGARPTESLEGFTKNMGTPPRRGAGSGVRPGGWRGPGRRCGRRPARGRWRSRPAPSPVSPAGWSHPAGGAAPR